MCFSSLNKQDEIARARFCTQSSPLATPDNSHGHCIDRERKVSPKFFQGRALYGPIPVKTETFMIHTEYDRAKVPPYNGNDPPPAPGSLKALLFPPLSNEEQNKGTQGVQAKYVAELPPFISIFQYPSRPVILGMHFRELRTPLVHTNFGGSSYGPIIAPMPFPGEIHMDQWA